MSKRRSCGTLIAASALLLATVMAPATAIAHDFAVGQLKIGHPWARATPPGAKVAGSYLTVENTGSTPDKLIGATVSIAGRIEIHEMSVTDGVMRMRELSEGIEIKPGQKIELRPGALHFMWMDLKQAPKKGEMVAGALRFEKAGDVAVEFMVDAIGAPSSSQHGH